MESTSGFSSLKAALKTVVGWPWMAHDEASEGTQSPLVSKNGYLNPSKGTGTFLRRRQDPLMIDPGVSEHRKYTLCCVANCIIQVVVMSLRLPITHDSKASVGRSKAAAFSKHGQARKILHCPPSLGFGIFIADRSHGSSVLIGSECKFFTLLLVESSDVPGVARFDPEATLADGTDEIWAIDISLVEVGTCLQHTFHPRMGDHVYFQKTWPFPIRTANVAFVLLFTGTGSDRLSLRT